MRVEVNAIALVLLVGLSGCAGRGGAVQSSASAEVLAGSSLPDEHVLRGMPWLEEALLQTQAAPEGEAAAALGAREVAVLKANGETEAARLRLAELEAIFPDELARWTEARALLEASGQAWTAPEVTWTSDPADTPPGGAELVLLWGEAFPRITGRDPQAVVAAHDRFDGSGLRVHVLVPRGDTGPEQALRLLGALNRPVGIGIAPAELWDTWSAGRTTIALLVRDGVVEWRGYPSQIPVGTLSAWLEGAHRASHKLGEPALVGLIQEDLGCEAWTRRDVLRKAGLVSDGEAAGGVTVVEAAGCGKVRHYVALGEDTWLSDEILFERL